MFIKEAHVFGYWVHWCCSCIILEVPTSRIIFQPILEALEGSVKALGIVSSEWGFHPFSCESLGEHNWWNGIRCDFLL
jgi:hypothetical protein